MTLDPPASQSSERDRAAGISVCVDGFNMALPKGSGIATYGRNLTHALSDLGYRTSILYGPAALPTGEPVGDVAGLVDGPPVRNRMSKNSRWRRTLLTRFGRTARLVRPTEAVIWPHAAGGMPPIDAMWSAQNLYTLANRAFEKYRTVTPVRFAHADPAQVPDLVHWTCPLPVHAPGRFNLVTVHDLIPLRLPYTTTDDTTAYLALCRAAVDRADHVVVVSEQTRHDVIELLGVDEGRVTNTYQAVTLPTELVERVESDAVLDVEHTLGLGWKDYFLYFGAVEPKKNLARLIEAHLTSGVAAPLVIVGGRGWLDDDEAAFLDQLAAEAPERAARIRRFPYMPFHLLISVIRGARAVVFPSLYEGFGLPVLEAMLLGTPVITSIAGSLPEVSGDAGLAVDPYDVNAIRDAIRRIDADEGLRAELSIRGRGQAATFTPELYSTRIRALYATLGM